MAALWLALVPSGQDTNPVINPAPNGPRNEQAQMFALCDAFEVELRSTFADYPIEWKRFNPGLQSTDTYHLENLYKVTWAVKGWGVASPQGIPCVSYNLHSDAPAKLPGTSHVGARVDYRGTHAELLTKEVCKSIAPVFGCPYDEDYLFDGTSYVYAQELAQTGIVPLLIEHGDHTVLADNVTLHTKAREVARAALFALVRYYKVERLNPPPPPPDPWEGIGSGLKAYCQVKGYDPRPEPWLRFFDEAPKHPSEYLWVKPTKAHPQGGLLLWRGWTQTPHELWF